MKHRFLFLAGLPICVLAGIGMYTLSPSPVTGERPAGEMSNETGGPALQRIAGIGFVEPESEIRRLVFPVDGVIGECCVKVGDSVKSGQTLMILRSQKEKSAVDLAGRECELAQADKQKLLAGVEANELEAARRHFELSDERLRHAKLEHERYASLRSSSAASKQECDLAESTHKQAELALRADEARLHHLEKIVRTEDVALADARIAVAREKVNLTQRVLDERTLRAPCYGTVLEILKREGDGTRVLDGQPSMIFGDLSRLRVRAEIDERHVHLLSASMPAVVTGRAVGFREFHGTVSRVNRMMGPKTVFARVADERRDLDVVQVLIDLGPEFQFPVGLRVDVYLERTSLRVDSVLDRSANQSKKLKDQTSANRGLTLSANPE
jgi:HlyD family secretion protein